MRNFFAAANLSSLDRQRAARVTVDGFAARHADKRDALHSPNRAQSLAGLPFSRWRSPAIWLSLGQAGERIFWGQAMPLSRVLLTVFVAVAMSLHAGAGWSAEPVKIRMSWI